MKRICLIFLFFAYLPALSYAHDNNLPIKSDNFIANKPLAIFKKLQAGNDSGIFSGLNIGDNGVTQMNDGHLLLKFSTYTDNAIIKYISSMGCSLSEKLSSFGEFDGDDKIHHLKNPGGGYYIKSGIETQKGSGIFLLATTGIELDSKTSYTDTGTHMPKVIAGGGVGYFLKKCSMQVGYDNKVGVSASIGILW